MTEDTQNLIRNSIENAPEAVVEASVDQLHKAPRLLIDLANPHTTVATLRDILAARENLLFERGAPARLALNKTDGGMVIQSMTPDLLILEAHKVCRPYKKKMGGEGSFSEVDCTIPRNIALMYLSWQGEWNLPVISGIASAPLLTEDGGIHTAEGYDPNTEMWCERVPDMSGRLPEQPTQEDARSALLVIRDTFKTFSFADAEVFYDEATGQEVVDLSRPPGKDETGFLCAIMTAVCRPSLHLAPGVLVTAPPLSGAGAGKGLLARLMCIVATGREPHAVTAGFNKEELDKRIAAELIGGTPALFLDNLNGQSFRSDLLASAITERPARVRLLGKSEMLPLNAAAFIILTGNGLVVSEDLVRRFIAIELDPKIEDPEARRFVGDIRTVVTERRMELLAACLTIWRWGRQHPSLPKGGEIGSFGQWCRWVRDPLLALGCTDPAARIAEAKERDGERQRISQFFRTWWEKCGRNPIAVSQLGDELKELIDPQGRGRQFQASRMERLCNTRVAGFVMTRQAPAGDWGVATYALNQIAEPERHRGHRGHERVARPISPMPPMPSEIAEDFGEVPPSVAGWSAKL